MDQWVKDSLCSIYQVHDNNYTVNVYYLDDLIDTVSDSKKFYFCESNIDCMIDSFNDRIIVDMDISNWDGHLIFNACIWYYNSCFWIS